MKIKSLRNIGFDKIFEAFSRAFEDYEIQLNFGQLETMLKRRGFVPELSFAAFEGDTIVSFTLNGIGSFNGIPTAYDTGTGTVKEFRGRHLASKIFEHSIPHLKGENVEQYLLEVLQHNTNAVYIYKKIGFEVSRELNYFVQRNDKITIKPIISDSQYTIQQAALEDCKAQHRFWDFYPSWQNSFDSIYRKPEDFLVFGAFFNQSLVGYCIFEPNSGDITQISIDRQHRRKGVGSLMLKEALKFNLHGSTKIINTDVNCDSITKFLESSSIAIKGKQFEMIKKI
ncbi:MAG: GNAT family N-acetyltransferase [Bacteroidales bacterium]